MIYCKKLKDLLEKEDNILDIKNVKLKIFSFFSCINAK